VLRDNLLMYFNSPKDFTGFRDKPSGVVLLEECNVREVAEGANLGRPYTFVLSHSNGESVVLAADTENDMVEWMQAVRTRMRQQIELNLNAYTIDCGRLLTSIFRTWQGPRPLLPRPLPLCKKTPSLWKRA